MARIHGRNGRLYADLTGAGSAQPVVNLRSWNLDASTDKQDVTAFGDTSKTYVSGLPDAQGTFDGFYDDATQQLFTAATDGIARKLYIYPSTLTPTRYWFGTALFDASSEGAVDGAVKVSGSWAAATPITAVGIS